MITSLIELRNNKIILLFSQCGIQIRLISENKTPIIIYKDKWVLNCVVNQNTLTFTSSHTKGRVLFKVDLAVIQFYSDELKLKINKWLKNSQHQEAFNVGLADTNVFLSGYNKTQILIGNEWVEEKIPVFSEKNYKIYFKKDYAEGLVEHYGSETLKLKVV